MKSEKAFLRLLVLSLALALVAGGCTSTVAPKPVVTHQVAFSDNSTNGGFVGFAIDGEGVITDRARAKYNALIDIYGKKFLPPITTDFGITTFTNNTFLITREGLSDFMLMNQWYKDGKK